MGKRTRPTLKNIPIPLCWPSTVTACSVRYTLACNIVINILLINLVVHIKNKFLIIIFGNINNIMTFT